MEADMSGGALGRCGTGLPGKEPTLMMANARSSESVSRKRPDRNPSVSAYTVWQEGVGIRHRGQPEPSKVHLNFTPHAVVTAGKRRCQA